MTIYRFKVISIGLIFSFVIDRACPKFSGKYLIGNINIQLCFGIHDNHSFHFISIHNLNVKEMERAPIPLHNILFKRDERNFMNIILITEVTFREDERSKLSIFLRVRSNLISLDSTFR